MASKTFTERRLMHLRKKFARRDQSKTPEWQKKRKKRVKGEDPRGRKKNSTRILLCKKISSCQVCTKT